MNNNLKNLQGKCVAYCRVSTRNEGQSESIDNQQLLIDKLLENNTGLELVETFIEKESAKSDDRKEYIRLLERITLGDIRYIISKNTTRLSRSTELSATINRICNKYNCKIIFTGDGTVYDPSNRSDVLVNGIHTLIAQDYVMTQSEYGKISHKIKMREKRLSKQNEIFGYRFDPQTRSMKIHDEEAEVVKLIFHYYVYENLGVSEIGRRLATEHGVYGTVSGKTISPNTITARLTNPGYAGSLPMNKFESRLSIGAGGKSTKIATDPSEWVYVDIPPIISQELFDMAQRIRSERAKAFKVKENAAKNVPVQARFSGYHLFARKIFCSCGNVFHHSYADRKKSIGIYKCSFNKKAHGIDECCDNKVYDKIYEQQLITVVTSSINAFLEKKEDVFTRVLSVLKEVINKTGNEDKITRYKKIYKAKERERDRWLEAYKDAVASGNNIMKDDILAKYSEVAREIDSIKEKIKNAESDVSTVKNFEVRLQDIQTKLKNMCCLTEDQLTRDDVDRLVDRIIIHNNGVVEVVLMFGETYTYKLEPYQDYKKTNFRSSFYFKEFDTRTIEEYVKKMDSTRDIRASNKSVPEKLMLPILRGCVEGGKPAVESRTKKGFMSKYCKEIEVEIKIKIKV